VYLDQIRRNKRIDQSLDDESLDDESLDDASLEVSGDESRDRNSSGVESVSPLSVLG
jgi:hypothetical protein